MVPDRAHRGASEPGLTTPPIDRRLVELDDALRVAEVSSRGALSALNFMRDPLRAVQSQLHHLNDPGNHVRGVIVHALPHANWYKVQVGDGSGQIGCISLVDTSLVPPGPRSVNVLAPNTSVLVYKVRGLNHGFIVGVLPPLLANGTIVCGDWLVQGAGTGIKREPAHKYPVQSLYRIGGVLDASANRPLDETAFWRGWSAPNGPQIGLSDWMIQLRINEMCGLWLSLWDGWMRIAAQQLRLETSGYEDVHHDDEGEYRRFEGIATYPWEALGLYLHGQDFTKEFSDQEIQYSKHRGKIDLPEGEEDLQPIYRTRGFGGYLGQGSYREVLKPHKKSGKQFYKDREGGEGLFRETIGLDGSYTAISAKRYFIGKRCLIVVPKEIHLPEDKKSGDDAEKNNYKFSGEFGSGAEHKVKDVEVPAGDWPMALVKASAVNDFAAYLVNWQGLHPFHYHENDFSTRQESDQTEHFDRIQEKLPFDRLANDSYLPDPEPKKVYIDKRYNDVDYFQRESFLCFHDDGTVVMGGGCGEQLLFAGGSIALQAPGRVDILPGTDANIWANQVIIRAKQSLDLSASEHDVRIKAERNFHCIGGNSGRGGVFIESRGRGVSQQFDGVFGEDVDSRGIVLKAAQGVCAVLGKMIYLRTGGQSLGEGNIVIDASMGKRNCYVYAKEFNTFTTQAVQFYYGPVDKSSNVSKVYYFGKETAIFDVTLLLANKLIGYRNAGVIVLGGVYGTKSFATTGRMADHKGGFLGKAPDELASIIQQAAAEAQAAADALKPIGTIKHHVSIVETYYEPGEIGDDQLIASLQFSFRDPPGSSRQYHTDRLKWPESRWQMMVRLGMATGGVEWTETGVTCQGNDTYPYPGRVKWFDEPALLQLDDLAMFDAGKGLDQDRPGPYEEPKVGTMTTVVMDGNYKLIR